MSVVFAEKRQPVHHPGVEAVAGVARHLARHVNAILKPLQLAAGRYRKDRGLAIFTPIAVVRYVFAIVSVTKFSVVW